MGEGSRGAVGLRVSTTVYKIDKQQGYIVFSTGNYTIIFIFLIILCIFGCAGSSLLCGLFSSCGKRGLLSGCGTRASYCVASLVAQYKLQGTWVSVVVACGLEQRIHSCGTRAQLLCGMWDLPRQGKGSNPCLLHWQADFFFFFKHWDNKEALSHYLIIAFNVI